MASRTCHPCALIRSLDAVPRCTSLATRHSMQLRQTRRFRTGVVARAGEREMDFDAVLAKLAEKFEDSENKPVVIGYGVGALLALLFTEWLIHLPGLDFLLGFPAQLVGLLIGPLLAIRYIVDKEDWYADMEGTLDKVVSLLPGLKDE